MGFREKGEVVAGANLRSKYIGRQRFHVSIGPVFASTSLLHAEFPEARAACLDQAVIGTSLSA